MLYLVLDPARKIYAVALRGADLPPLAPLGIVADPTNLGGPGYVGAPAPGADRGFRLYAVARPAMPDFAAEAWDGATLAFVPQPPGGAAGGGAGSAAGSAAGGAAPRLLSNLDFINRFTAQEQVAFELVAVGINPADGTPLAPVAAAQFRALMRQFTAAGNIDPDDPLTIAGVDALIALGLVAPARRNAVLAPAGTYAREKLTRA